MGSLSASKGAEHWLAVYDAQCFTPRSERTRLLEANLGSVSAGAFIRRGFYCISGHNIHLADRAFANYNCAFYDAGPIHIGEGTFIGPGVAIHSTPEAPVRLGRRCWIGGKSTIVPGVTVADDVIVGAGALVTQDVGVGEIVVGAPAKPLPKR